LLNSVAGFGRSLLQFIKSLQIHPGLRTHTQCALQPQRSLGRNASLAANDIADLNLRETGRLSEPVLRNACRLHEFLAQNASRMYGDLALHARPLRTL
jgi:hypothetical protein